VGILQVRYQYTKNAFDQAETSTAYNADYVYAAWRACYDGEYTWLNTVDRGKTYKPGDLWGCVGVWFAGRWYTPPAQSYIAKVQSYLRSGIWTQSQFLS
jgi:autotransporter family porin